MVRWNTLPDIPGSFGAWIDFAYVCLKQLIPENRPGPKNSSLNFTLSIFRGYVTSFWEGSNFPMGFAKRLEILRPKPGDVCETTAAYSLFPGCQMWKFPMWPFDSFPGGKGGGQKWVGESLHLRFPSGLFCMLSWHMLCLQSYKH